MKIKKTSLPDEVCNRIKENISNGQWKIYDKIPSEGELSEIFGVNRLTVRMALQKLNTLGIVETRVGEGTYVKNFSFSKYITEVSEFYMRPELLEDVCEFRKLLEIECARLAIERATPEEIEQLNEITNKYDHIRSEIYQCQDWDSRLFKDLVDVDLEFHHKIVKMSKNSLYSYSFTVAKESIYQYLLIIVKQRLDRSISKRKTKTIANGTDLHRIIYKSIVTKDFETCKKAYLDMVDHHVDL